MHGMIKLALAAACAAGCQGSATASLALANQTGQAARTLQDDVLADGTSLRLRILAVYLAEDVDPATMNNIGATEIVWLNPQCHGDITGCNVDGFTLPAGPRVTDYFDLARPTAEVDAELNSQDAAIAPGTYRYARVEMCKSYDTSPPTSPTMMWAGPGMTAEQPFTSGDCGRTSAPFASPMTLADGDAVTVTLGYDLAQAIVAGPPAPSNTGCGAAVAGHADHCYRACVDVDADTRTCMDFPDFIPAATAR